MSLFTTEHFPSRWNCGTWYDWHGWLHITSDLLIWSAYMAIPIVLLLFIRNRDDIPFPKIVILFAAFIFVCGTGHLIEAIIFWHPVYYFAGVVKAITALVSWCTVAALIKLLPTLLTVPSTLEAHKKLMVTMREMDRSNKMLSEFSSACAHHLKEPLRGIHNYSEIVLRNAKRQLDEEEVSKLATVSSLSQRLDGLLTAMLRFSEVHNWKAIQHQEDLHALVIRSKESVVLELERVGGTILVPRPLPIAFCDAMLTKQLFATVFLYAISRADQSRPLQICVEVSGTEGTPIEGVEGAMVLAVRDNGTGIAPEELDTALSLFGHQVDRTLNGVDPSLFLGPSFAKALAEAQGQTLWVESTLAGETTVFVSFSKRAIVEDKMVDNNEKSSESYSHC